MKKLILNVDVCVGTPLRQALLDALALAEQLSLSYVNVHYGENNFAVAGDCTHMDIDRAIALFEKAIADQCCNFFTLRVVIGKEGAADTKEQQGKMSLIDRLDVAAKASTLSTLNHIGHWKPSGVGQWNPLDQSSTSATITNLDDKSMLDNLPPSELMNKHDE